MLVLIHGTKALQELQHQIFMDCVSPEKVNLLDATVYLVSNYLKTEIYTKPTNTHQNHCQSNVTFVISKSARGLIKG